MVMPSGVRMDSDWMFMGQTSLSERTKRLFAAGCQAVLHKIKNAPDSSQGRKASFHGTTLICPMGTSHVIR